MKFEFNVAKLTEAAKARWFKTLEIYQILKNLNESNLKGMVLQKLPERPSNGTFFLIDGNKVNKKWKQDGYSYVRRNNGMGFREDVVYLKIAGIKEVMCSYSYLDHSLSEQSNLPNCRRVYKLVNPQGNSAYFLVHYLNEKGISEGSTDKTLETYVTETPFSVLSTSDEASKFEGKHNEEEFTSPSNNLVEYLEKATNSEFFEAMDNLEEKPLGFVSYYESNHDEFSTNFINESENKFSDNFTCFTPPKQASNLISQEALNYPPIVYDAFQEKFYDIESRLNNLEMDKPSPVLQPLPAFPTFNKDTLFNIVDYSPEWDYTKGGAKVIICVSPLCMVAEAINDRLKVQFGEASVPGYFIQPGVIKCYAPPHTEGFVKLSLRVDGEMITTNKGNSLFEYRKQKKQRNAQRVAAVDKDLGATNEFKVRIVEKMKEYNTLFEPTNTSGQGFANQDLFRKYVETNTDEIIDLDTFLPEEDLLKIMQFMVDYKPKSRELEFQTLLNKKDREGYTFIHYLCFLKYNECLLLALNCGATPNVSSNVGITPLEISLKHKNEKMLDILLSNEALGPKKIEEALKRTTNVEGNQLNFDIASLYKDRNLLDMLLREVSLCDSINNSLSAAFPENDNHSDDSYLSLYDLIEDKFDGYNPRRYQQRSGSGDSHDDEYFMKEDEIHQIPGDSKDRRGMKRPRRYFRNYDKKNTQLKENINMNQKADIDPVKFTEHQNQVQIIQKNVRGWLLRRQYLDILHATRVLQNYIRGKTAKKKNNEDEEQWNKIIEGKLKNKVKDWLNIKE